MPIILVPIEVSLQKLICQALRTGPIAAIMHVIIARTTKISVENHAASNKHFKKNVHVL